MVGQGLKKLPPMRLILDYEQSYDWFITPVVVSVSNQTNWTICCSMLSVFVCISGVFKSWVLVVDEV